MDIFANYKSIKLPSDSWIAHKFEEPEKMLVFMQIQLSPYPDFEGVIMKKQVKIIHKLFKLIFFYLMLRVNCFYK